MGDSVLDPARRRRNKAINAELAKRDDLSYTQPPKNQYPETPMWPSLAQKT